MEPPDLVLVPWADARRLLGSHPQRLRVLAPPYPAVGTGALRVLRVRAAADGALDVVCGYEGYARLP